MPINNITIAPGVDVGDLVDKTNEIIAQVNLNSNSSAEFADFQEEYSNASTVLVHIKTVDGANSGLDADLLDGQQGTYYSNASNMSTGTLPGDRFNDVSHGNRAGGTLHVSANSSIAGFMSAADKTKLDGVQAGATDDLTAGEILENLKAVDGAGSLLDADLLDGQQGTYYLSAPNLTGTIASARIAGSYTGFTNISGTGTGTFATWYAGAGSAGSPAFSFTDDTNTGMFRVASDTLGFATNGAQRLALSTSAFTSTVAFSGTTGTFSGSLTSGGFVVVNYGTVGTFTKAQRVAISTLSDLATITINLSLSNKYTVTLAGNRNLANPTITSDMVGQSFMIFIKQDGVGNRTLSYGSYFAFPFEVTPVLTTTANRYDILVCEIVSTTRILANLVKGFIA